MAKATNPTFDPAIADLPEKGTTRNGVEFAPRADKWRFLTNSGWIYFDHTKLHPYCSPELVQSIRKTLVWYLENRSIPYASITFNYFREFLIKTCNSMFPRLLEKVEESDIINYRATLDILTEWHLGCLRTFFFRLDRLGYPGIDSAALSLLDELTLKGARKGWMVLTMDPEEGPFTNMELRQIQNSVASAYGTGTISNRQYALVWLFMALGLRPSQVADLKVGDLEVRRQPEGGDSYILKVPRVKQRSSSRRQEFKAREIIVPVGKVLAAWCEQVKVNYSNEVADLATLPIFPSDRITTAADPGFDRHADGKLLAEQLTRTFEKLSIVSSRTGGPLKVKPYRFRYTLGARAVVEKAGAAVIAELLDHSDTQNVMVYLKLTDEVVEAINAELADDLVPLAQAFRGEIILFEDADVSDPSKFIRYPGVEPGKGTAGQCQGAGGCGAVVPVACYVCPHFTAFADGPHSEVLAYLLAEKQKELELGGDQMVASATEEAILAVRTVMQRSEEIKGRQHG